MTYSLLPRPIRRYDGGSLVDADSVIFERAGLGLPAESTAEQWAEYTEAGIGAAKEIAEHAVRVVEGLADGETDTFKDATAADVVSGYRLGLVAAGTAMNQISAADFSAAMTGELASGSYDVYVVAPERVPTRRLRVVKRRNDVSRNMFPGQGQSWESVTLPISVLPHTQVYRLAVTVGGAAAPVTSNGSDIFVLQIGTPVQEDTSGLRSRVSDLEDHAVEFFATLPDASDHPDGAVIVVGEDHYVRQVSTHTVDDETVATAGRRTFHNPESHLIGVSNLSDSARFPFGQFTANFANRVRGAWAFSSGHSVHLDTAAYTAAHGSAPVVGSTIHCTFAPVGDIPGWTDPYEVVLEVLTAAAIDSQSGEVGFNEENSQFPTLYRYGEGHAFSLVIRDGDDSGDDILFTHEAGVATWARWTRADPDPTPDVVRYQETRDVHGVPDGSIVVADNALLQAAGADASAGSTDFTGRLERWEEGDDVFVGTSLSDTRYGSRGRFHANLGFAVGALTAGGSVESTVALRLESREYQRVKGSAVAASDTVIAQIRSGDTTTRSTLAYLRNESAPGGEPTYHVFLAHDPDSVLHTLNSGDDWEMQILSAYDTTNMTGTALYAHGEAERHFVEYPIAGVDQMARDSVQAQRDSVEAEIEKLHGYIAHHIASTSSTPLDPTAADAVDQYYLTRKGRVSNVALETGLYELTTGVADRLKLTLERITLADGSTVVHGVNTRSFLGPDGGRLFGTVDHNPLSICQALWMEGDWINACFKASWFNDNANRLIQGAGGADYTRNLLWLHIYPSGETAPVEIELAQSSGGTGLGPRVVRGEIQYAIFAAHVPSAANKDVFRHLFPFTSGSSGPRDPTVTVDIALSPVSYAVHSALNPHYRLGRANGDTMAYTWRAATESRLARNFNALIDLLAPATDLSSILDSDLTALKL